MQIGMLVLVLTVPALTATAQKKPAATATNKAPAAAKAPIAAPLAPKPPPLAHKPAALPSAPKADPQPSGPSASSDFDAAEDIYRAGDWEKALKAFQDFETKNPYSGARPMSQYYQGWCLFNLKRYDDSIKVLTKLIMNYREAPIIPEATLKLAECYREMKNLKAATAMYVDFQKKNPNSPFLSQAIIGESWVRYKNGDHAGARQVLNQIFTRYGHNLQATLDAQFLMGQIYTEEKKFAEAHELFRRIAEQSNNPRASEALFSQAESFYEAKNYADAIKYFKRVQSKTALIATINAQLEPLVNQRAELVRAGADLGTLPIQIQQLQSLAVQLNQRDDIRAVALFRIANAYQELKRPEEASVIYRILIEKYFDAYYANKEKKKTIEFAMYGLIQALTESRRLSEANLLTERFKKEFPDSVMLDSAGYMQAISIFSAGNFQDALDRFQKFLPTCKNAEMTESTEFYIAACNYGLENFSKAIELFNAFLKKHPNSKLTADVLFRLGRANFELAQRSQDAVEIKKLLNNAIQFYEQVRSKYPKYESLHEVTFQLGYLYNFYGAHNEPGAYDKAVAAFTDFVTQWPAQTGPNNRLLAPEAYYQTARAHLAAKHFAQAIEAYNNVFEKYPDNELAPYAAMESGSAYFDLKQPEKGLAALCSYTEKYPTHVKVGDVLFAIGSQLEANKTDEALKIFTDLVARTTKADDKLREAWLNPAIEAQRHIANILEKSGDIKPAVASCENFLQQFANEPVAVREIFARLSAIYRKAKLAADGYAEFDKLAQQYSKNATFRIAAATSAIELALAEKDYTRAADTATKLLKDPENGRFPAVTYIAIGNTFLKTAQMEQSRNIFQKSLSLYPHDKNAAALANLGLGQALLQLKDFNGAQAAFEKQMPADPSQAAPEALLGLAKIYEEQGRGKDPKDPINVKAIEYYQVAARSGRRDIKGEAFYRIGMFLYNSNEKKGALPFFMQLFSAPEPFAEEGQFRQAECHETLGNFPTALTAYRLYTRRYPNGKFKAQADAKVAELTAKIQATPAQ